MRVKKETFIFMRYSRNELMVLKIRQKDWIVKVAFRDERVLDMTL